MTVGIAPRWGLLIAYGESYESNNHLVTTHDNYSSQCGSKYSADSINNPYGTYGSEYSNSSPNNPYATNPPVIIDNNDNH